MKLVRTRQIHAAYKRILFCPDLPQWLTDKLRKGTAKSTQYIQCIWFILKLFLELCNPITKESSTSMAKKLGVHEIVGLVTGEHVRLNLPLDCCTKTFPLSLKKNLLAFNVFLRRTLEIHEDLKAGENVCNTSFAIPNATILKCCLSS